VTPKQTRLLKYLERRKNCPSYDEMRIAMGMKSKSGVHRMLRSLEAQGCIKRLPNHARSIVVIPEEDRTANMVRENYVRLWFSNGAVVSLPVALHPSTIVSKLGPVKGESLECISVNGVYVSERIS